MTKELAKRLKDAGFPERTHTAVIWNLIRYRTMDADAVSFPFLQELISECGEGFESLTLCIFGRGRSKRSKWFAGDASEYYQYTRMIDEEDCFDTPEEAVAEYWLKNKK